MHNQSGSRRRCLYCGQLFEPVNGNASFCCYGHFQLYNRGEVYMPEEPVAVPQQSFFARPPTPGTAYQPLEKRLKPTDFV